MLISNFKFFNKLNYKKDEVGGTLLFDVLFEEQSVIYGIAKTALLIARVKKLSPLGIRSQELSKSNRKFIKSMCFETTGSRLRLVITLLKNLKSILLLFLKIRDGKDLLKLRCEGVGVGVCIYDGILRSFSIPTITTISFKMKVRIVLELVYFFLFSELIKRKNVKFIVCSDNVYRYGLLFGLARENSIPCIAPINLNGFSMAYYRNLDDYENYCRRADEVIIGNVDVTEARGYLEKYFIDRYSANIEQHDVLLAYSNKKVKLSRGELYDQYDLNPKLPVVILMAHIFSDAPHAYPSLLFNDYYDWFVSSLESLVKNKNINFLVKEHPSAALYNEGGLIREILEGYGLQNKLVKENVHNLTVLNEIDIVVTCGGTIGQEFSYMRKPVVLAAKPPYSGYGFTVEPASKLEYLDVLSTSIQNLKKLDLNQYDLLLKVLYYDLVLMNNYDKNLELGGQKYYLGRQFDYDLFYQSIIKDNEKEFFEQSIYKKLDVLLQNENRHILNLGFTE